MSKVRLDENGFDRMPHNVTSEFWYYEETSGLQVYLSRAGETKYVGTISWRSIRASLKRKDAVKTAKCWSCGKPQRDVDGATCRGCGHVVCLKCAKRYGHIVG